MDQEFLARVRRLETAQARQNEQFNRAAGGASLPVGGGFAHRRGEAHPFNQALGLLDPLSGSDLDRLEAFLGPPVVLELSPGADPGLWPLLAQRGYRLHQFQQLWTRPLPGGPLPPPEDCVRVAALEEADLHSRIVSGGFQDQDDWRDLDAPFAQVLGCPGTWGFLAFAGETPAGGGLLGIVDGVALLAGDGVLPRFRGRGLQKALVRARLRFAAEAGCDLACASTLPGTPSHRAYEACGFRAAYPKVEMVKDG